MSKVEFYRANGDHRTINLDKMAWDWDRLEEIHHEYIESLGVS